MTTATDIEDPDQANLDWAAKLHASVRGGEPFDPEQTLSLTNDEILERVRRRPESLPMVQAKVIRQAILDFEGTPDPRGLQICGVRIVGDLDLDFHNLGWPLSFDGVSFDGSLSLRSFRAPELKIYNSVLHDLVLDHAEVAGALAIHTCRIKGKVTADVLSVGKWIFAYSEILNKSGADNALEASGLDVRGDMNAYGLETRGAIRFVGGSVGGFLSLDAAKIRTDPEQELTGRREPFALLMDNMAIAGVLQLEGAEATSALLARGVRIGGQLRLMNAKFGRPAAEAGRIDLTGAVIVHDALLTRVVADTLLVANATMKRLDLSGAHIKGVADASVVGLGSAFSSVLLSGGRFGGVVDFRNSHITESLRTSLRANATSWTSVGALVLSGSRIDGELRVDKTKFTRGIEADRAVIFGSLSILGGSVLAAHDSDEGRRGCSFRARGATLQHLRIQSDCEFAAGLDLTGSNIDHLDLFSGQGDLQQGSFPDIAGTEDVTISRVSGPPFADWKTARNWLRQGTPARESTGPGSGLPEGDCTHHFHIQPWLAVAASFERLGRDSDARRLKFAATDAFLSERRDKFSRSVWRRITKYTIGHGYYSQAAVAWIAGLWLLSTVLVGINASAFSPSDLDAALQAPGATESTSKQEQAPEQKVAVTAATDPAPPAYPSLIAPLYAVDVVLSPLGTGQSEAWRVSSAAWLSTTLTAIKLLSWALLGLFVTGVTGVMARK